MRTSASEEFRTRLERALAPGAGAPAPGTGYGSGGDGDGSDGGDELAALVRVAVDLRDAGRPLLAVVPRQEFRTALAQRLVDEATELAPARREAAATQVASRRAGEGVRTHQPRGSEKRRRVRGVVAGLVALVVAAGAGAAVASESALPGGVLYPLKRQVEDLRLQLSSPGSARGGTELALARERLVEAEDLALASGGADVPATDTPQLRSTLDDFGDSASAGIESLTDDYARTGDATSLAAVNTFLDETVPLLERLREMTPPSLHPVIDELLAELGDHRTELAGTVASCASCRDLGLVVAIPSAPSGAGPDLPGATAGPLPGAPVTVPPVAGGAGGTGGGALDPVLDPLDPVLDPLDPVVGPVETVIGGILPTPSSNPTSTPLLPPLPLPTLSLPPLLPPGTSSTTPSASNTCILGIRVLSAPLLGALRSRSASPRLGSLALPRSSVGPRRARRRGTR